MNTQMDDITLCLTIGKRPDELRQTLQSLLAQGSFEHIIAINDFGDDQTNEVFRQLCPHGKLISLGYNQGHHRAIDTMYADIKTPYVLHCEDDWLFDSLPDFERLIQLLASDPQITVISLRQLADFDFAADELAQIVYEDRYGMTIAKLDKLHDQWHGYTFNPHFASIDTYRSLVPFARFKKERHISRTFRSQGKYVAYLQDAHCHHIGFDSVANPPKVGLLAKLRAKLFG